MFQERYRKMNEEIAPAGELLAATAAKMHSAQKNRPARRMRRAIAIAAAAALVIGCGTPALAANVPGVYETLYLLSPATAQFFMPVNEVSESSGVKMEVVSAYVRGDTAGVYLTMQDLTGERFNGSLDLYDSYSLHYPARTGQMSGCSLVAYDDETKTATFLIEITNMDGEVFGGSKYTFSVRQLLTGQREQTDVAILGGLGEVPLDPPTEQQFVNGASTPDATVDIPDTYDFLKPQAALWQSEDGVFSLSALGYRGGKLHALYATTGRLAHDNHGWFQLTAPDGTEVSPAMTLMYQTDGDDTQYSEFIYDVSYLDLPACKLTGSLYTADTMIEGDWRVTFRLPHSA